MKGSSDKLTKLQSDIFLLILSMSEIENLENITEDSFFYELKIDSLTFVKLIVELENQFCFEFDNELLLSTEFHTIWDMIKYVESKVLNE